MTIALTSPVTGGAQTGLTTPTYTLAVDTPVDINGKQWAVTALGGTQTGVSTHSSSNPFTWAYYRPKIYRLLGKPNPSTGLISNVPMNTAKCITRKGMVPAVNQPAMIGSINSSINIPAGCDVYAQAEIRAMISLHIGALMQISAAFGDTVVTGLLG